jgi:hypothetical protein
VSNQNHPQLPQASGETTTVHAPYEKALSEAFRKLTDQVLIFLLAYVILLIGVSMFAPGMRSEFRALLYIIPILGVAAYVLLRRRGLCQTRDVRVRSGIAMGPGTYVGGERGVGNQGAGRTTTGSLIATGGATVVGRDVPANTDKQTQQPVGAQYLLEIFRNLDERNQRELVNKAQTLLNQQQRPDG